MFPPSARAAAMASRAVARTARTRAADLRHGPKLPESWRPRLDNVEEDYPAELSTGDNFVAGPLPDDPEEIRPWLFGIARLCLANAARKVA